MADSSKKQSKRKGKSSSLIASNKKAYHDFIVEETYVAGIVLTGTEIKSLRQSGAVLGQSFARIKDGEVFLMGMSIAPYEQGTHYNHEPERTRKLLLTRQEIRKLIDKMKKSNYTLVPLKLFFSKCWVKVSLGLCLGKKTHDKRATLTERTHQREMDRAKKQVNY